MEPQISEPFSLNEKNEITEPNWLVDHGWQIIIFNLPKYLLLFCNFVAKGSRRKPKFIAKEG